MKIILPHWLELVLGVRLLDDAIVDECVERAKRRCGNVDVFLHSRETAEAALAVAAREAVVAVFQDYFPLARRANLVREGWPKSRVILLGNRATIQIWIGLDYEDVDGIEPFDITVVRPSHQMGVIEKIQHRFSKAPPPVVLREEAPAAFVAAKSPPPSSPPAQQTQPKRSSRMTDRVAGAKRKP